ncbi:MAG TPA: alcohol dehydrogenase family protein [Dongiaceae bacterium]|jgi:NADPH:quinone reductase-like Zn-dependent oxidoreductase|nr:alcohol dehydrogenase family protein [Dongiaceae bacterium]
MMKTPRTTEVAGLMRAMILTGHGGLDKLVLRDVPRPRPSSGEVLIKVGACGVNNTEINTRTAWYDRAVNASVSVELGLYGLDSSTGTSGAETIASWNSSTVAFPRIQGAAIAGRIVAAGSGVDTGRLGQRVLIDPQVRHLNLPLRAQLVAYIGSERDGGFAEYVAVPAENAHVIHSSLSDAELATFPCSYDTAEEMLERARLAQGETIVITGAAGGVGTALIQLSLIRGARVVAIAGAAKEARVRALGAHEFVARESGNWRRAVENLVGEQSVDVAADVVGGAVFGQLLKLLRRGGRYTTAGAIAGPVQPMDLRDLIYKDLEMYGITCPTPGAFARIVGYIQSGQLRPLVERIFPLAELPQAQAEFLKREHFGKFVIVP